MKANIKGCRFAVIFLLLTLLFTGCSLEKSKNECLQLVLHPESYEEEEIRQAFQKVKEASPQRFKNSKLLSLIYSEEMQIHMAANKVPDMENIVISVSICGAQYETAGDRADYYCLLTRQEGQEWTIEDWALDRDSNFTR